MQKLTWARAAAWRAHRQHLVERAPLGNLHAVASNLCGLHAQVMSSAELTAWARVERLSRDAVRDALWNDRSFVKTWAMRGTLHLLPASDLPLFHAALAISPRYLRPVAWQNNFGISLEELDRITQAVGVALHDRLLTREQLAVEVGKITGSAKLAKLLAESSWGVMLKPAAFTGQLCFGPSEGTRVRFTHPATWAKTRAKQPKSDDACKEITRRFLRAYGPATARDLARWWNGGGIVSGRQWIAALGDEVVEVQVDDTRAWMLASDAKALRDFQPTKFARLLPGFDQYVVAASCHVEHLLPGDLRARIFRPQGWISPVLLVNGMMQGVWRHEMKGSKVLVTVEPFCKIPAWARREAEREAQRLSQFLGGILEFKIHE